MVNRNTHDEFAVRSPAIHRAVTLAAGYGNKVSEISEGWSKIAQVVQMQDPLERALRSEIEREPELRYWRSEATPHNCAAEGFTDDQASVALSFPRTQD